MKAHTVADLIKALQQCDPDAVVHTTQPPFVGVVLVPQEGSKKVLIAPPKPGIAAA